MLKLCGCHVLSDNSNIKLLVLQICYMLVLSSTVKPVLSDHPNKDQKLAFNTDYCLMQVKSIAECSKRAFCNTLDLH